MGDRFKIKETWIVHPTGHKPDVDSKTPGYWEFKSQQRCFDDFAQAKLWPKEAQRLGWYPNGWEFTRRVFWGKKLEHGGLAILHQDALINPFEKEEKDLMTDIFADSRRVGVEQSNQPPIDAAQALLFCDLLGKKEEETHVRAFPHKKSKKQWKHRAMSGKILAHDIYELEKNNLEGRSVYSVVNDGGVSDSDITDCRAIFCEWDDKPIDWQITAWKELGLPEPTFQVLTGGKSVHSYWVFK